VYPRAKTLRVLLYSPLLMLYVRDTRHDSRHPLIIGSNDFAGDFGDGRQKASTSIVIINNIILKILLCVILGCSNTKSINQHFSLAL
jgi:hypothetical protein